MFPYLADDDFGVCFIQLMNSIRFFSIHSYMSVLLSLFVTIAEFVFTKRKERGTTPMFAVNTPITRGLWREYLGLVTIASIRRVMTPHPIKTNKA